MKNLIIAGLATISLSSASAQESVNTVPEGAYIEFGANMNIRCGMKDEVQDFMKYHGYAVSTMDEIETGSFGGYIIKYSSDKMIEYWMLDNGEQVMCKLAIGQVKATL